jgi:hypothetical protein
MQTRHPRNECKTAQTKDDVSSLQAKDILSVIYLSNMVSIE